MMEGMEEGMVDEEVMGEGEDTGEVVAATVEGEEVGTGRGGSTRLKDACFLTISVGAGGV